MAAQICFSVFSDESRHIDNIYARDFEEAKKVIRDTMGQELDDGVKLVIVDFVNKETELVRVGRAIVLEEYFS